MNSRLDVHLPLFSLCLVKTSFFSSFPPVCGNHVYVRSDKFTAFTVNGWKRSNWPWKAQRLFEHHSNFPSLSEAWEAWFVFVGCCGFFCLFALNVDTCQSTFSELLRHFNSLHPCMIILRATKGAQNLCHPCPSFFLPWQCWRHPQLSRDKVQSDVTDWKPLSPVVLEQKFHMVPLPPKRTTPVLWSWGSQCPQQFPSLPLAAHQYLTPHAEWLLSLLPAEMKMPSRCSAYASTHQYSKGE